MKNPGTRAESRAVGLNNQLISTIQRTLSIDDLVVKTVHDTETESLSFAASFLSRRCPHSLEYGAPSRALPPPTSPAAECRRGPD